MRMLLVLAACSNSNLTLPADAGMADLARAVGPVTNHRTDDSACASAPGPGDCTLMGGFGECSSDGQCTSGSNGRCVESTGGALTCRCSYDTCTKDGDCGAGKLCACHGSPYTDGAGNTCMPGNCRVDSDCPGSYCSPSAATNSCGGLGGYYCHVAADQCQNDGDCSPQNGPQFCAWSAANLRWQCAPQLLCP